MSVTVGGYVKDGHTARIVGVVGDTQYRDITAAPDMVVYLPMVGWTHRSTVVAQLANPEDRGGVARLRALIAAENPGMRRTYLDSMANRVAGSLSRFSLAFILASASGMLALILAGAAVYGLMASFVIAARTDLAIRVALGATPGGIRRLVLSSALRLILVGLCLGLGVSLALAGFLRPFLYHVQPWDVVSQLGTTVLVLLASLLAAFIPAHRAAQSDPAEALKAQ